MVDSCAMPTESTHTDLSERATPPVAASPAFPRARARGLSALRWLPVALWMGVIFGFSTLHGSSVPGHYSSLGHLGEYTILGALMLQALALYLPPARAAALAVVLSSAYGVTDELHQAFVPGRTPDVVDWGVDTLGALLGALLLAYLIRKAARRRPSDLRDR